MKWFKYITEVIAAIRIAVPLIRTLVEQFETPGFGAVKLKAVLEVTRSALLGFGVRESIVDWVMAGATGIINAIVALKNIVGEFTHGGES